MVSNIVCVYPSKKKNIVCVYLRLDLLPKMSFVFEFHAPATVSCEGNDELAL
jgi:hypothetical protein